MSALSIAFSIAFIVIATVSVHLVLPWFIRNLLAKRSFRQLIDPEKVYLTFDDGPDPLSTPKILDTLANHSIKATFFVIGELAEKHPQIIDRIRSEGHTIGSHSYRHSHAWKTNPISSYVDFKKGALAAQQSNLWRPPYGKANLLTLFHSLIKGIDLVYWTNDPRDYESNLNSTQLVERLSLSIKPGDVVLLHDGRRTLTQNKNITPDALARFLNETSLNKSDFATIS